eukprot:TRINITY_DN9749_c0_g1_i1.p1 TRINITY_DN9749_c0_g1~~TRINITY_DN9749_c0_g1_i1.p1  ORF type:complete len:406 (-),score=70.41 TRINITY_DN9749_c0_g1_i1:286-1503(-)
MELLAVKDAFDRVAKKQKVTYVKTNELIDKMLSEISAVRKKVEEGDKEPSELKLMVLALHTTFSELAPSAELAFLQKELNGVLGRYGKVLEKNCVTDLAQACWDVQFSQQTLNRVMAQHFYREGMFDIGDAFAVEAGLEEADQLKAPFLEMYTILEQIKTKNLEPALNWAKGHRAELLKKRMRMGNVSTCRPDDQEEDSSSNSCRLEFLLHQLQFIHLLHSEGRDAALLYARANFGPFAGSNLAEIQRLMGCLLWAGRIDSSPYSDLLSDSHWDQAAENFRRECCDLIGQSFKSPLSVTLTAGSHALPTLLKLSTLMTGKWSEWLAAKQMQFEVELGREFQFHSIFACPVSREQSSADNPPMLMPCGHVLCKQSIMKLGKGTSRTFKCPYCPGETTAADCKTIYF